MWVFAKCETNVSGQALPFILQQLSTYQRLIREKKTQTKTTTKYHKWKPPSHLKQKTHKKQTTKTNKQGITIKEKTSVKALPFILQKLSTYQRLIRRKKAFMF